MDLYGVKPCQNVRAHTVMAAAVEQHWMHEAELCWRFDFWHWLAQWTSERRRSSVVSEWNPGFDPLEGQGEAQIFCPSESTLVQPCLCLNPLRVCARTQICAHVKDPISTCRKKVGLTAGGIKTQKHCTQGKKTKKHLGGAGQNSPNFLHWDQKVI